MAYSRKRARKYFRRVKRATRRYGRKTTGIKAPYGSRGFYGPGYKKRGKIYVELKKFDSGDTGLTGMPVVNPGTNSFDINFLDTGESICIFAPPVGSGISDRVGRRVNVRSIQCRGSIRARDPATVRSDFCRLLLVVDMQANGTALSPGGNDVLGNGNFPTSIWGAEAYNNLNNRSRFKILMDWKYSNMTGSGENMAPGAASTMLDYYKKVNFPVTFTGGNTGLPADIATAKIFLLAVGRHPLTGDLGHVMTLTTRVRFVDP